MMESRTAASQRRRDLLPLLCDFGLPLAAYYLLRTLDASLSWSYAAAAAVGAGVLVVVALRERRLDGIAAFMLAMFVAQLAVSILTGDVWLAVLTDSVTSGGTGVVLLGSCVVGRPAFQAIVLRVAGRSAENRALIERRWDALPGYRRLMSTLSAVCGIVLVAEAAVRIFLVLALGPDALVGVSKVLQLVTTAGLVAWVVWFAKRSEPTWA